MFTPAHSTVAHATRYLLVRHTPSDINVCFSFFANVAFHANEVNLRECVRVCVCELVCMCVGPCKCLSSCNCSCA